MKPPEIYEHDYLEAIRTVHECSFPNDTCSIYVRNVESYKAQPIHPDIITEYKVGGHEELTFKKTHADLITGRLWWSLQTKITIIPNP